MDRLAELISPWIEIAKLKPLLLITLLGNYSLPDKNLIVRLRDFLVSEGYKSTKLVEDWSNHDCAQELDQSKRCIQRSDVCFFILPHNKVNSGVIIEILYILHDLSMEDHQRRCVACIEIPENKSGLPTLPQQELDYRAVLGMLRIEFKNEIDLQGSLLGSVWKYTNDLQDVLRSRKTQTTTR